MKLKHDNFFDNELQSMLKERVFYVCSKLIRIFIICVIAVQFFSLAVSPTPSMYPTITTKDLMLVDVRVNIDKLNRGDIVSFVSPLPEDNGIIYVKRLIGLPGEEIEVKDKKVFINGEALHEEYLYDRPYYEYPKTLIPNDSYFMLGDNRNISYDSSRWGFVPEGNITGRVIYTISVTKGIKKVNNSLLE